MEHYAEIHTLAQAFYCDYPSTIYPELLKKQERPYSCLLLPYFDNTMVCIPFRTNMSHSYGYRFRSSKRSRLHKSGLDYTKIVLLTDIQYLDTQSATVVDQDEYKETMQNLSRIAREAFGFINDYKNHLNGIKQLHPREWQRRYGRSTLPYFDDMLRDV